MKTTKISVVILSIVLTSTLLGLVFTAFRSYDYLNRIKMPNVSLWYLSKSLCFGLLLAIGLGLFWLIKKYQRQGFFDTTSMKIVKIMGWATIVLAVPNSVFNVLKNIVDVRNNSHLDKLTPISDWIGDFWIDIFSESSLYIILGMLILLFANFIQKAIAVKSENESFV